MNKRKGLSNKKFHVVVKPIGDWAKLHKLVYDLDNLIHTAYNRSSKKAATKFYRMVRSNIQDGGSKFAFPKLAQSTIDRKIALGFDPSPFVFYGYYYRSVKLFKKKDQWHVGIKKGAKNPKTGKGSNFTIAQYASVLETGSRDGKIPARPLWKETFKLFGGQKKVKAMMIASIAYELRKRHNIRTKLF